jgi:hypothetical protein
MKARTLFGICVLLCVALPATAQSPVYQIASSTVLPFPAVQTPVTRPASQIHVLLVGDTNASKIGRGVRVNLENLASLFHKLVPVGWQLQMRILSGDDVNKANIVHVISDFHPAADDAFVFVWTGHGAYNEMGHYFYMPNGEGLYRADVVRTMQRLGPRLVLSQANSEGFA